jgi:hypothetical protein
MGLAAADGAGGALVLDQGIVELTVSYAADECRPLRWSEAENGAFGVLAVADADVAVRHGRYLDAVAIGIAQRALGPPWGPRKSSDCVLVLT